MLKNDYSFRWIVRLGISLTLALIVWIAIGYSQNTFGAFPGPILQGNISIETTKPFNEEGKVQPGSSVKLKLSVSNIGQAVNIPAQIYIRYAFIKPLENEPTSVIFQTEKISLPSIDPGKHVELAFNTTHHWPSLFDFIRNDWPMREYQAVLVLDGTEKIIGMLSMTVSAYYYPGLKKEYPTEVPALSEQLIHQ